MTNSVLFFCVSFCASVVGAVCGIGGGVIIKPVLDMFGAADVSAISFLSGCTVLAMSCFSVCKSLHAKDNRIRSETGTPLAIGAAIGGTVGKQIFDLIKNMYADPNTVGAVQSACLALITLATLIYTIQKARIRTHQVNHPWVCILIGILLGISSSFLGIGGGPINLVVLFYFFSMDTKTAAANSLYIILFSQAASLLKTLISGTVPAVDAGSILLMTTGGILGGAAGRHWNRHLRNSAVEKLFLCLMVLIIAISIYNFQKYL